MSAVVVHNYPAACPVCAGCGTVPHDFYTRFGVATSTGREPCRPCAGTGIAWTECPRCGTETPISEMTYSGCPACQAAENVERDT